jgi:Ni/Co efflux regulator RcnB
VIVYDYHRYGYGPPPRGYHYYRTSTGEIILAAIATGLILSVFAGAF